MTQSTASTACQCASTSPTKVVPANEGDARTVLSRPELRGEGLLRPQRRFGTVFGSRAELPAEVQEQRRQPHPRFRLCWGFNSTGGAGVLHGQGLVPESPLPGLTTVGWLPAADIGLQKGQGAVQPPGLNSCLAIMEKKGLNLSSDTDLGLAGRYCDALLFFRGSVARSDVL